MANEMPQPECEEPESDEIKYTADLLACVREAQKLDQDFFTPDFQSTVGYNNQTQVTNINNAYDSLSGNYQYNGANAVPSQQCTPQDPNHNNHAYTAATQLTATNDSFFDMSINPAFLYTNSQQNIPNAQQGVGISNQHIANNITQSEMSQNMSHGYSYPSQYYNLQPGNCSHIYQQADTCNYQSMLQNQNPQSHYPNGGTYLETLQNIHQNISYTTDNNQVKYCGDEMMMVPQGQNHESNIYMQESWDLNMSLESRPEDDGWKEGIGFEEEEERGFTVSNSESDVRIREGFILVNKQNYNEAISLFNEVLATDHENVKALVGRGTAKAMSKDLQGGDADFTEAIKIEPEVAESWKRRGQVRAALGQTKEALEDLEKSQTLLQDLDVEIQKEIALLYQNMGDNESAVYYFQNADQLLRLEDELDPTLAKSIWNAMGLALNTLGRSADGVSTYQKALQVYPDFKEAHINIAQAYKELANIPQAMAHFNKGISCDPHCVISLNLLGLTEHSIGLVRDAHTTFTKALKINPEHTETLYMHGVCAHGLGRLREAVEGYCGALKHNPRHFAYYLHQMALFTHHHLDKPLKGFNLDRALHDCFKEAWTKKLDPKALPASYRQQCAEFDNNIPDVDINKPFTKEALEIAKFAAHFGAKNQYNSVGFVANMKQHRWAGLAMVDMAQTVQQQWHHMRTHANNEAMTVTGLCSSSEQEAHLFGWRDMFDIAVKWRQVSEPLDSVWWIDLLNPEAFGEGFGSQTPMKLGQNRVVRYFPYFSCAFPLIKSLMPEQCSLTEDQIQQVREATTCGDLHNIVMQDLCVVTPCPSHAVVGRVMEGTHLTITKATPYGYSCSIRTPCTPTRWELFAEELAHAWRLVCEEAVRNDINLENLVQRIVHLIYYWYNFMPLTRGSAACGLVCMNALLLAAGWEITTPIPRGFQWDWEAIFQPSPEEFQKIMMPWIMPNLKRVRSDLLTSIGKVSQTFGTMRQMIHVLNYQTTEDRLKVLEHNNDA